MLEKERFCCWAYSSYSPVDSHPLLTNDIKKICTVCVMFFYQLVIFLLDYAHILFVVCNAK
jgi:hypothetical protein